MTSQRLIVLFTCLFLTLSACGEKKADPVVANGEAEVTVMDFSKPVDIDNLPPGWSHHKFWTRYAMDLTFGEKDGVKAIRAETNGGGSIFGRYTDISLNDYPTLTWNWYVEVPIKSDLDERTPEGDDHPARLFIEFTESEGEPRHMEIVWSNGALKAGEYKYVDDFPHYVANGGDANIKTWHRETVDLLDIYRKIGGKDPAPRITLISIFCDSDETQTRSVAWFGDVKLLKK